MREASAECRAEVEAVLVVAQHLGILSAQEVERYRMMSGQDDLNGRAVVRHGLTNAENWRRIPAVLEAGTTHNRDATLHEAESLEFASSRVADNQPLTSDVPSGADRTRKDSADEALFYRSFLEDVIDVADPIREVEHWQPWTERLMDRYLPFLRRAAGNRISLFILLLAILPIVVILFLMR